MNRLEKLKSAENIDDLSKLLGFKVTATNYILHGIPDDEKYHQFEIPKKNGTIRIIQAPNEKLKLLQSRLKELLYACIEIIQESDPKYLKASHGFLENKTIISNGQNHVKRRYVFNIDIKDFFPSLNFGRVRGFFIKDKYFSLHQDIATIIAQIACYQNGLPQGSPCSPVISNLIGNILDSRLLSLAKKSGCVYSRYADDLTFSTNKSEFPQDIAIIVNEKWEAGNKLQKAISHSGFELNPDKTRMSFKHSQQAVTGLVVNQKINISQKYYRNVRSMCHSLFQTGFYHRGDDIDIETLEPLEGMLSHICFVKERYDRKYKINKELQERNEFTPPKAPLELYKKFLYFKYFIKADSPVILTEGKTDIIYLKYAILSLANSSTHSSLINTENDIAIKLFKSTPRTKAILNLGNGASGLKNFIHNYEENIKQFKTELTYPVIMVVDNDRGSTKGKNGSALFSRAKQAWEKATNNKAPINIESTEDFYYLGKNLYLIKVPEKGKEERAIENLFPPELLEEKIDGKSFELAKNKSAKGQYSKEIFARKIVQAKWQHIDFSGFSELLSRIEKCILDYENKFREPHR